MFEGWVAPKRERRIIFCVKPLLDALVAVCIALITALAVWMFSGDVGEALRAGLWCGGFALVLYGGAQIWAWVAS